MAFEAKVVPFQLAASTTTGTLDIESTGFGTPQACIIVLSGSTSDSATLESDAILSIGFSDGLQTLCAAYFAEDAETVTQTTRTMRNDTTIVVEPDMDGATSTDGEMRWSAWATDGVTLAYQTGKGFNAAYRGYVILIKGATNVLVDAIQSTTSVAEFRGYGFDPDAVFFLTTTAAANGTSTTASVSLGFAVRGAATQGCVGIANKDAASSVAMASKTDASQIGGSKNSATTGWNRSAAIDTWEVGGFDLIRTGSSFGIDLQTLAIKMPSGQDVILGRDTSPASATSKSVTTSYASGTDDSELVIIMATSQANEDVVTDECNGFSFGAADSAGNEAVASISDDDSNGTAQSGSAFLSSSVALTHTDGMASNAVLEQADMTNMTSPDLTINYSTAESGLNYFHWIAFQKAAAGGTVAPTSVTMGPLVGPTGGPV